MFCTQKENVFLQENTKMFWPWQNKMFSCRNVFHHRKVQKMFYCCKIQNVLLVGNQEKYRKIRIPLTNLWPRSDSPTVIRTSWQFTFARFKGFRFHFYAFCICHFDGSPAFSTINFASWNAQATTCRTLKKGRISF
jgi:hypothetical protein